MIVAGLTDDAETALPRHRKTPSQDGSSLVTSGNWSGQLVNAGSVTYGTMDQPDAPRRIVEFTYLMLPILLWTPTKRETGGVLMLMPSGIETPPFSPGFLQNEAGSPMILLSLHADRQQFSDLVGHIQSKMVRNFSFNLAQEDDGWRVTSWSLTVELRELDVQR